jgi:solute carrier family 13 (sodium-dependent dicarboxylate transporter), member 2/3/5
MRDYAPVPAKTSSRDDLCLLAALAAYPIARAAPILDGLTAQGQAVLGITLAGAILWISEAVPLGVTALVVLVLLALTPGLQLADAVAGFASDVTFFLVGAAVIGAAVETSGLAERAARSLGRAARASPTRLYA